MRNLPFLKVFKLTDRSSHVEVVTNLESVDVLTHLAALGESLAGTVGLDDKLDATDIVVGRNGSVPSQHHLAIDVGRQEQVLASRQTKNVLGSRKSKVEQEGITRQAQSCFGDGMESSSWGSEQACFHWRRQVFVLLDRCFDRALVKITNVVSSPASWWP